eukprot:IDg7504t1
MTGLPQNEGELPVFGSGSGHQEPVIKPPEEYLNDSNEEEDNIEKLISAVENIQEAGKVLQEASMRTASLLVRHDEIPNMDIDPEPPEAPDIEAAPTKPLPMRMYQPKYDFRLIHRIYGDSLRNIRVSKIPDYRFETAHMTWTRLMNDMLGLPNRLRLAALSVQGSFDEVVSRVSLISTEFKIDREGTYLDIFQIDWDESEKNPDLGKRSGATCEGKRRSP